MTETIVGKRRLLWTCYLLGALISTAGLVLRLGAFMLATRVEHSSIPGAAAQWEPIFGETGMLVAGFGFAILLLTLHHHLAAPPAPTDVGRGFEAIARRES